MTRKSLSIPEYKSDDEPKEATFPGDTELTEVDVEVNAEIMRRLLVFLGMQDLDAKKKLKSLKLLLKQKW